MLEVIFFLEQDVAERRIERKAEPRSEAFSGNDRPIRLAFSRLLRIEATIQRLLILGRFNPPFFMAIQNAASAAAPAFFMHCSAWLPLP